MRNGYKIDTLTSVDIQEIFTTGGMVIQIYEGVICQENIRITPFRKVMHKLIAFRQKYKDERVYLMQASVKLIMNILYGVQI